MISNHHRLIILEYLYQYKDLDINQMTLVVLGKIFPESIAQFLYDNHRIFVYHVKGQRVFTKQYPFESNPNTITEMMLTIGERLNLSFEDFTYEINDPFYLKDIRHQIFTKLIVIPLFNQDKTIYAYSMFYLKNDVDKINIDEKRLNKLIYDLIQDEVVCTDNYFQKQLIQFDLWSIEKDNTLYLSPSLVETIGLDLNLLEINDKLKYFNVIKTFTFEEKKVTIYQDNQKNSDEKPLFFGLEEISSLSLNEHFTIIYFQSVDNEVKPFKEHITIINHQLHFLTSNNPQGVYQINEQTLILIFNESFHQRRLESFKQKLKFYRIIYLRPGKEFHLKMDLKAIINYIHQCENEHFVMKEYLAYREQQQKDDYLIKALISGKYQIKTKKIVNSLSKEDFASYVVCDEINDYHDIYQMHIINFLQKEKINFPFFQINAKTLTKRNLWTALKKLSSLYDEKIGIIITNGNIDNQYLIKYFNRLINLGYYLIVDHYIFTSLEKTNLLNYYGGIFIKQKILNSFEDDSLCQEFIKYYLQNQKIILIESNYKYPYLHGQIFYLY